MEPSTQAFLRGILKAPCAGSGASDERLQAMMTEIGYRLPDDYLDFMRKSNGYTGGVGANGFISVWPVEEIVPTNKANRYLEWIPGLVLFASNESGDFYAFDMRVGQPTVVFVPAIPLELQSAVDLAPTFMGALERLARM